MAETVTKRNYVSLADVQVSQSAATLAQLDQAEQAIDDYVGWQNKFASIEFRGLVSGASGKTIVDNSGFSQLHQLNNYFRYCVIEILDGTAQGQVRFITSSSYNDYSVTVTDAFDTEPAVGDFFRIYQLGRFPRVKDVYSYPDQQKYSKAVPDAIKQAVIAQVAFIIEKGADFFIGDDTSLTSETIGNYQYSRDNAGQSSSVSQLAPRARALLKGYKNSTGRLDAENPTCL